MLKPVKIMFQRTPQQIEYDRNFAVNHWLNGYRIRDIQEFLTAEHTQKGTPYKPSLMMIQRDIAAIIKETRIQREKSGIDTLEEIIAKYYHIHNESMMAARLGDPNGRRDAAKALDAIAKIKGLVTEKAEVTIKYDVEI